MDNKFTWPTYPQTDSEFDALMRAIDKVLWKKGVEPFRRPIHVSRLFWEAFGWGGRLLPPKELALLPGFDGDILIAKAHRWYENTYGERLKADFAFGYAPVKLGNAIWRVRFGVFFGEVNLFIDRNLENRGITCSSRNGEASYNVLCAVENLTQALVGQLHDTELDKYLHFYKFGLESLMWRNDELPDTELLNTARADYDASTADVLGQRYGQARWGAQQAVEKTIKGLLKIAGTPFPTNGTEGHNLKRLGELLQQHQGITIAPALLDQASCPTRVRYGEDPSTEDQAFQANHAVLGVLDQLRKNPKTATLLKLHKMEE